MNRLDHVVIAAPDLTTAKREFEERTGVAPADGGQHVGLGTRNALVSFGPDCYLEIVAPDPEQTLTGTFGARLAQLSAPTLLHWAIRTQDLPEMTTRAADLGLAPSPIRRTKRAAPDGTQLEWELLGVGGHQLGGLVPFYIDWLDCDHPADSAPLVGSLESFEVTLPAGHAALGLLDPAPADVTVSSAAEPGLVLRFDSPREPIVWTETAPLGFAF
jgi:hypothetical protein